MPEPTGAILTETYGLFGSDKQPLETVAKALSLSLDEADKLRMKGIRKLRDPRLSSLVPWTNEKLEEEVWRLLSDRKRLYVMRENVTQKAMECLSGEFVLETIKRYGSIGDCLSGIAVATDKSWVRSEYELEEIKDAIDLLTKSKEKSGLPRPIRSLTTLSGIALELLTDSVYLSTHFTNGEQYGFHADYVIDAPASARTIRIVRIHRLMRRYCPNNPISTGQLIDLYREHHGDDDLDSQASYTAMRLAPFLFLRTSYNHWLCIHPETDIENSPRETDLEFGSIFFKTGLEEVSARATVMSILRDKRIVTERELQAAMVALSKGKYDKGQLGNIYNTESEITYLAPGVVGLESMAADVCTQEQSYDKLLNKQACLCFIAARAAGEPRELYPLWHYAMEYRWCRWGKDNLSARDFEALLFVSEPELWPVDKLERERWSSIKRSMGRYLLSRKRAYILDKSVPSLKHLFRIALEAKASGDISWVRVNWITRRRLPVPSRACTLLAFLVIMDVLDQVEHWCLRHPVGTKIEEFIAHSNTELYLTGDLQWSSPVGLEILATLRSAESRTDLKLITPPQIHSFILDIEQRIESAEKEADVFEQEPDIENTGARMEQLALFS